MKRAIFEIKLNAVGRYYFIFKDDALEAHVVSASFGGRSELEKCLAFVRDAAPVAAICDTRGSMKPPLFEISGNQDGFTFSLVGFKGETIFSSKVYEKKTDVIKAIENIKSASTSAGIVDLV